MIKFFRNKSLFFIITFIFITVIFPSGNEIISSEDEIDFDKEEIRNPFSDYELDNDEKAKKVFKKVQKTKREKPDFIWQGLIASENSYRVLLSVNGNSHLLAPGESLEGYRIVKITVEKISLKKAGKYYFLTMGRD